MLDASEIVVWILSAGVVPIAAAVMEPSATRMRSCDPGGDCSMLVTTSGSEWSRGRTCTTEYPRARVAAGPNAETCERSAATCCVSRANRWLISRRIEATCCETSSLRRSIASNGFCITGRERQYWISSALVETQVRSACALRARASDRNASSWAASMTTRFAASVGVAARRSATLSSTGLSGSCPMADTTGVPAAATARCSASSENGRRSSTEPPPRAMMMTSTLGSASSVCRA